MNNNLGENDSLVVRGTFVPLNSTSLSCSWWIDSYLNSNTYVCAVCGIISLSILAHVCCFYSLYMPINVSYLKRDSLNIIMKLRFFSRKQIGVYQINVLEMKRHIWEG